jgi:hypothetical protein
LECANWILDHKKKAFSGGAELKKNKKALAGKGVIEHIHPRRRNDPRQREIVAGGKSSNKTLTDVAGNLTKQPATKRQLRSRCE